MPDRSNSNPPLFAAIQLSSSDDLNANLEATYMQLDTARQAGAACAILPENFAWMGDEHAAENIAEPEGRGPVQQFLSETAKELGLWIIGGSHRLIVPNDKKQRVTNTTLVYNPYGDLAARYDKIHLFDADVNDGTPYLESASFKAGKKIVVVDMGIARVGLSICYDLRFPELYQALGNKNADAIVVPAAFTVPTGQAHWQLLLRARAIENQVYIIAPAQCGTHSNGRKTWGHSLCINPWGEIISELKNQPGTIFCPIDIDAMNTVRREMPVAKHHRPELININK